MRPVLLIPALALLPALANADMSAFTPGPTIDLYGPVANVDATMTIPENAAFRHSFDVGQPADEGELNRTLVSAARFINMHARAGFDANRIELALVVHGKAIRDVSGEGSDNAELVAALIDHGVKIYVCGQTAAYYDVGTDDLLPGVEMALSAMTVHAMLQQQGYTINPF